MVHGKTTLKESRFHVQNQYGAHAVIGKSFPHFSEEQVDQSYRMPGEFFHFLQINPEIADFIIYYRNLKFNILASPGIILYMAKILLVEDDKNLAILLKMQLEQNKNMVEHAKCGLDAMAYLRTQSFDLIILDWMLPDVQGIEVCKEHRNHGGKTPILMLTARGEIEDKALGLNAGADDYLVKPFHPTELDARVNALLRRPPTFAGKTLKIKDLELDTANSIVTRGGSQIDLTAKEFGMLELLMRYPNKSFTLEAILDRVWDSDSNASIDSVRTHMKTLRKKLGDSEENGIIRTKRGQGYRIVDN